MFKTLFGSGAVAVAVLALAPAASASTLSFSFDHSGFGSPYTDGPFGNVVVSGSVAGMVDVKVTLNQGNDFVVTGNGTNHPDFGWSLGSAFQSLTSANITLVNDGDTGNFTWNFKPYGPYSTSGAGAFGFEYNCGNCGNGGSPPVNAGPLEFTISMAGITPDSFVANADGHFFVADIINSQTGGNGATGLVWADAGTVVNSNCTLNCDPAAVPEPASLALLGTGLAAAAFGLRRKLKS